MNVALAVKVYKTERFILISTDKAVIPMIIIGATKRLCGMIIQSLNTETEDTDFVAVGFGNVVRSNGSVVPSGNQVEHAYLKPVKNPGNL